MISPQFKPIVGGYERACERLSLELATKGHEVMVCAEHRDKAWPKLENLERVRLHRWWCVYRPGWHVITSLLGFVFLLLRYGHHYQIWHVHQYGIHAALAVLLGKLKRRPVVLKLTNSGSMGISQTLQRGQFSKTMIALHRKVDAVVALTQETAFEAKEFGIPGARVHMLGNGVDADMFKPPTKEVKASIKCQLGLDQQPVVIFIGRMVEAKNIEGLIDAWRIALESLPVGWKLVLIGDGPMRKKCERIALSRGFSESVHFAGQQGNVDLWLSAADIYVSTSWREGLSNTLLEAMSSGLPIIATKVSGVPVLVEATGAGIAVELGDMKQVAIELVELALNSEKRQKMGDKARQFILDNFSINIVGARHVALYNSLCGEE